MLITDRSKELCNGHNAMQCSESENQSSLTKGDLETKHRAGTTCTVTTKRMKTTRGWWCRQAGGCRRAGKEAGRQGGKHAVKGQNGHAGTGTGTGTGKQPSHA